MKASENNSLKGEEVEATKVGVKAETQGFRASEELDNLYRFVSGLGLRKEVKLIFQRVLHSSSRKKSSKGRAKPKPKVH